jgi:hypothetical protein
VWVRDVIEAAAAAAFDVELGFAFAVGFEEDADDGEEELGFGE